MTDLIYSTNWGKCYCGKSEEILPKLRLEGQIQLILTSPPFPLNKKKQYGNLAGEEYLKWFTSLAELFSNVLAPNGSIVIEMGNSWEKDRPVQSLLHLNVVLNNITALKCDLYYNSLVPVVLANKLVSLADHPSSDLLKTFAQEKIIQS